MPKLRLISDLHHNREVTKAGTLVNVDDQMAEKLLNLGTAKLVEEEVDLTPQTPALPPQQPTPEQIANDLGGEPAAPSQTPQTPPQQ